MWRSRGSSEAPFSIRERQKSALLAMLKGACAQGAGSTGTVWKVLVFDDRGGDIMYLLMRVRDLRAAGVTLSLRLEDGARERLEGVPAVYFVEPTPAALAAIARDLGARALYSSASVHAVSAFDRPALETLARAAVREHAQARIARVWDQHSDFLALEDDLFVTGAHGPAARADPAQLTYSVFNGARVADAAVAAAVARTAQSLFGVVLALGVVPIIRAPRHTPAAAVAEALHRLLQHHLASASSATASGASADGAGAGALLASAALQRPLLLLCDRNIDLGAMLAHPWHYRGLVSELMDFDLNRVTINSLAETSSSSSASSGSNNGNNSGSNSSETDKKLKKPLQYELDTRTDKFWAAQCGAPFPEMAVALDNEVKGYKAATEEIGRYARGTGAGTGTTTAAIEELTEDDMAAHGLQRFADRMPALRETKGAIDRHTTVAHELMARIRRARLDEFFELEDALLRAPGTPPSDLTARVRALVCDPAAGAPSDRLRLFLVWHFAVSSSGDTADARHAMESALTAAGADMRAYVYAQRITSFLSSASAAGLAGSSSSSSNGGSNSISSSIGGSGLGLGLGGAGDASARMVASAFEKLVGGVKALLPRSERYRVARTAEALMDLRGAALGLEDAYLYLDPRLACEQLGAGAVAVPRKTTPFRDAIVFVVGGGSYVEHQNVVDLCRRPATSTTPGPADACAAPLAGPGRRIIYGATEMLTPEEFLQQLSLLGDGPH